MCGIVGYIGDDARINLINILKQLEYRGYDSSGIATNLNGKINTIKSVGKISDLEKIVDFNEKEKIGIAHTRWATHGIPSYENTHPHTSNDKKWAIVHNGIIENYSEIKNKLIKQGFYFYGETDSEIVGNLMQFYDNKNKITTLLDTCNDLDGSYALVCMYENDKKTLYLAKNKCPLYVAKNEKEVVVASDPICFSNKMKEYYSLNDFEFCKASLSGFVFYNSKGKIIIKKPVMAERYNLSASKNHYKHYMIKEINEIPTVLKDISRYYSNYNILGKFKNPEEIKNINKIVLIGCGTAYHASMMGAKYIEQNTKIECHAHIASEYRYKNPMLDDKTLVVLVSQSGETADTLAVCEMAKEKGATTVAITNVEYSSLAKKVDYILPVCAGPEIAVASTKAYCAQVAVLYILSKFLKSIVFEKQYLDLQNFNNFTNNFELLEQTKIFEIINDLKSADNIFFIGRDMDYITCLESSLKLKEITYINSSAYPAGELKHGFLALIDNKSYVFVYATEKRLLDKTLNGANEALSRGAKIILITCFDIPKEKTNKFYKIVKLKKFDEDFMPIYSIQFGQLVAYYTSISKGINPDQPRNLAKSVTVE